MNTKFDKYSQPEKPKIYLGTPNNKRICALTGIDESSFKITENFNNADEISFDIFKTASYRSVLSDDQFVKDNQAFTLLSLYMRIYVEGYGWFIIDPPDEENDSYKDKYSITAQSAEIEFQQHNLHDTKINQGTTDSYEMLVEGNVQMVGDVEFAKEQIKFYNPTKPELSFLDVILKIAGVFGWTIGEVDTTPKTYKYFDEGVQKEKKVILADEIGVFDVDSKDLYSFLTQDVAKFFNCVFVFDYDNFKINVYHPENYGQDTNVNISFRNFQKSNTVKIDDSNIFTRYYVQGSDELGIEYVNFGSNYIENIDYFLNERYLSKELIIKYKMWQNDVNVKRNSYIEYTRLYNAQFAKISELCNRVPLDDCSTDWSTFSDEKLSEAKENYEAQLKGYESYYVDENGDFDEVALQASPDADDYYQIKNVIIPSIQIEQDNRNLPSDQKFDDYIDSYKTDWKLYGLDELDNKLQWYRKQKKLAEDEGCNVPYSEESKHTKDYHEKLYSEYEDAVTQLDPDNPESCQSYYNKVKAEVDEATELQNSYDEERKRIAKSVAKETWSHDATEGNNYVIDEDNHYVTDEDSNMLTSADQDYETGIYSFTQDDLDELSKLYIDGDYSNENMFITSSDDSVTTIDEQLKLLDAAQDDLYITSHPQYQYSTDLDNFIGLYEYREYTEKLNLGDYLYLSPHDDEVVKLRAVSMTYNPFEYNNDLQITFSNMIQGMSSRSDLAYLLGQSSGGSKNSSVGSSTSNSYLSNEGVSLTPALIQKLVQSGAFANRVNQIIGDGYGSLIGGTLTVEEINAKIIKATDIIGENGYFEYLQAKLISADKIVANSATFNTVEADLINVKKAIVGASTTKTGIIINLTSENATISEALIKDLVASYITVNDLKASNIITDRINVVSENGRLKIVGDTLMITDENDNPVIQLGRDKNNNYGLVISDANGAILLDSQGLHEGIVPDNFIKNDMIDKGTITKDRLAFNTVDADEDGNISAGKVLVDGKGVDVEFKSIKSSMETMDQKIDENATYELRVTDNNGRVFNRGIIETTLEARLYKNGIDITDKYDDKYFIWTRKSSDTSGDQYWNEQHSTGTKTIRVTKSDVYIGASFGCSFNYD